MSDTSESAKESFLSVVPFSNNHVLIFGRTKDNFLDVVTDLSDTDQIFITTKYGRYVIDDEGHIRRSQ